MLEMDEGMGEGMVALSEVCVQTVIRARALNILNTKTLHNSSIP